MFQRGATLFRQFALGPLRRGRAAPLPRRLRVWRVQLIWGPPNGHRLMTSSTRILRHLAIALVALAACATSAQADSSTGGASAPTATTPSATTPTSTTPAKTAPAKKPPPKPAPAKATTKKPASALTQHVATPIITRASCYKVRRTVCVKNPHVVQISGELVFHGHNLKPGLTVYFPVARASSARQKLLGARLRPTNHGLVVTIPSGAASGRIYIAASAKIKSSPYGPIAVLAAPAPPRAPTIVAPTATPASSAFDSPGMWIWYLSASDGGQVRTGRAQ